MDPLDSLSDSERKLEVELDDELRLHLGVRIEENNARATQKFVAFVAPQGTLYRRCLSRYVRFGKPQQFGAASSHAKKRCTLSHGRHCGMEIKMKTTRLLVAFFVLFGSAITLGNAGNQLVSAAAPSAPSTAALRVHRSVRQNRKRFTTQSLKDQPSGKLPFVLHWKQVYPPISALVILHLGDSPLVCPANMGYSALIHVHLSTQPGAGCIPAPAGPWAGVR